MNVHNEEPGAMHCPKCKSELVATRCRGVDIDTCTNCKGMWVGAFSLEELIQQPQFAALISKMDQLNESSATHSEFRCPFCADSLLSVFQHGQITVDWCPQCRGIFFDAQEMKGIEASQNEDVGALEIDGEENGFGRNAMSVVGDILYTLTGLG